MFKLGVFFFGLLLARMAAFCGDLAERNAAAWSTFASDAARAGVFEDAERVKAGASSIRFETESGFDTGVRFPKTAEVIGMAGWSESIIRTAIFTLLKRGPLREYEDWNRVEKNSPRGGEGKCKDRKWRIEGTKKQPEGCLRKSKFCKNLFCGLFLFGFVEFLQIFCRVFFEVFLAIFATEMDFTPLVFEDIGIAHLAEFFVGDDAGLQRVGLLGFFVNLFSGHSSGEREARQQKS
jgi:hypothetical protein